MDWESFYEPLPDLSRYLKRIEMEKAQPSRSYLDALIEAHQCHIPFETLDVTDLGRPISLRTRDLFSKIILGKRGGYCFELNGLLVLLLRELGLDAYSCIGRLRFHPTAVPVPASHRGCIVRLGGKRLYCDAGFGTPSPLGTLDLDERGIQVIGDETYQIRSESTWYTIYHQENLNREHFQPLISISPTELEPVDFYAINHFRSQGDSPFTPRIVAIRTASGHVSLVGNRLTEVLHAQKTQRDIPEEALKDVLRAFFSIVWEE